MDLRKAILLKKPLQDSSFSSLNSSTASMYESAAEDSDSSLYYSFSNNSIKELNNSEVENVQDPADVSLISEADDKENTVIMKHIDVQSSPEEDIKKVEDKIPEKEEEVEQMEINDSVMNTTYTEEDQKVSADKQIPEISNSLIVMSEKSLIIPTIIVEDPNENLVNPFTMGEINPSTSTSSSTEGRESIETDNVTKRKVQEVAKKSASRIPTRSHLYSPIRRNSLDKKSKIITKPAIQRRTVFETRSAAVQKPTTIQKPKQPVNPPVQSKMAVPKPVLHKCTSSGCLREFHTVKLLEQHLKSHNSDSSSSSSTHSTFKCKWCDKIFERNNALTLHMIDKCTKITFPEKRKLLAQQDKSNQTNDNKRRTVFMAPPAPKKRSPRRITTHNKSGIMITPKKTLKCECGKKFTDVLEFANHTITHKYENALKPQPT
ncbi:unnamed protein product [Chironomus riparius]|uniref:C2H2-type domain-containing protein n=1 Tax=Chironomus riparius TaxID=315576 RepID=A0A9P0IZQ7_9DIPT|nr:unnamed protein product [Chironomus riparius]